MTRSPGPQPPDPQPVNPHPPGDGYPDRRSAWRALTALVCGFFLIMVDATIVTVAMPAIMTDLDTNTSGVVWVTSAYLLAFAVPLLITGRLGDRLGPKRVYLAGLAVFTLASALCAMAPNLTVLIIARVLQGVGASMISPQSMAVITRMFPPRARGTAMGIWGAVGGVATFAGPLAGGVLVGTLGWEWIFWINLPLGAAAIVAAVKLVPTLERAAHRFDLVGVALSAVGMFCLVFGLEEGHHYGWGTIAGPLSIPLLLVVGVVVMAIFVWWQTRHPEPLVPLSLFRERDFSVASIAISAMGGIVTAINIPLMFYLQDGRGFGPTEAAIVLLPSALVGGAIGPFVGRYIDRNHPRSVAVLGFALIAVGLALMAVVMSQPISPWWALIPSTIFGVANGCIWGPLSVSATRRLPRERAGAGSGVYNTTRQFGAVLGTAMTATLIASRLDARVGDPGSGVQDPGQALAYSQAMADVVLTLVALAGVGLVASFLLRRRSETEAAEAADAEITT